MFALIFMDEFTKFIRINFGISGLGNGQNEKWVFMKFLIIDPQSNDLADKYVWKLPDSYIVSGIILNSSMLLINLLIWHKLVEFYSMPDSFPAKKKTVGSTANIQSLGDDVYDYEQCPDCLSCGYVL